MFAHITHTETGLVIGAITVGIAIGFVLAGKLVTYLRKSKAMRLESACIKRIIRMHQE